MIRKTLIFAMLMLVSLPAVAQDNTWACPDVDEARRAFNEGQMSEWPNYSEADAARVQRQHPDTAIIAAQAKFIDWNGESFAICQYYTHIGLLAHSAVLGTPRSEATKTCSDKPCGAAPYWRQEFAESTPEQDRSGNEQLFTCMEDKGGLAYPSVGCRFTKSE